MQRMNYASVCDGIGAVHCAWQPLGLKCLWTSEIAPFPAAVVEQRWGFENLGDFTKIGADRGPVDVLVGGTPCQSFSVAGLRGGMADERGGLALEFLKLAARLRAHWVVWENVPGVLSSNKGRDFGAFLGGLGELGYGFAYRVLDAQHFGVPQRRRRVFVVGHLGDWRPAAAVLFERHSLSGHPAPRREAGEGITGSISARPSGGGGLGLVPATHTHTHDLAKSLNAHGGRFDYETETFVTHALVTCPLTGNLYADNESRESIQSCVRRLTPRECERLQGFPDDYTLVSYRGKPAADGPRYKAIGNSMAVPCMRWIGERLKRVDQTA